jgi:hypothetical protein
MAAIEIRGLTPTRIDLPGRDGDLVGACSCFSKPAVSTRIPPTLPIWASGGGILNFSIGLRFDGESASTLGVEEFPVPLVILFRRRRNHVVIAFIGAGGKCSTCDSPLRPK